MGELRQNFDDYNVLVRDHHRAQSPASCQPMSSRIVSVTKLSRDRKIYRRFKLLNDVAQNGGKCESLSGSSNLDGSDSPSDTDLHSSGEQMSQKLSPTSEARRPYGQQQLPNIKARPGHVTDYNRNKHSQTRIYKTEFVNLPMGVISHPSIHCFGYRDTHHDSTVNKLSNDRLTHHDSTSNKSSNGRLTHHDSTFNKPSNGRSIHTMETESLQNTLDNSNGYGVAPRFGQELTVKAESAQSTTTRQPQSNLNGFQEKATLEHQPVRGLSPLEEHHDVSRRRSSEGTRRERKASDGTEEKKMRWPVLCPATENKQLLCRFVEKDVFGADDVVVTTFGMTKVTYLDFIASGRPLKSFEKYIRQNVLPSYSNTHTEVNHIAKQTSQFREEARAIIRECVNASDGDVVIFAGSGATAGVHKLIHALSMTAGLGTTDATVFLGPYEHHSNMLPWRETGAEVITVPQTRDGLIDVKYLSKELEKRRCDSKRLLIGSFSAASNVTGILTDVDSVASLMHKYRGLVFFDYACAAPYTDVDMNPADPQAYKDAIFVSPHKFMGGPQTPGVLIVKRHLFRNAVPHNMGGGTVVFVRRAAHRYLNNIEEREEGGTPAIVESVRAGLAFKLKAAFTPSFIVGREFEMLRLAKAAWSHLPGLVILGSLNVERLPIFSMLFLNKDTGRLLHHDFVAMILNDVFGLQVRSGCACAGPYGMDLMGMSEKMGQMYERLIVVNPEGEEDGDSQTCHGHARNLIFKPGFVRLSFPYFMSENCFNFVLRAIEMTAEHGWLLLSLYNYDRDTGKWWHRDLSNKLPSDKSLKDVSFKAGEFDIKDPSLSQPQHRRSVCYPQGHNFNGRGEVHSDMGNAFPLSETGGFSYEEILNRAERIFAGVRMSHLTIAEIQRDSFDGLEENLRWFMLPSEAVKLLNGRQVKYVQPDDLPFTPKAMSKRGASQR